jgi:hypothetical protein
MSEVNINRGSTIPSALMQILDVNNIEVGTDVGYETCKILWAYHPLGGKLVEKPVKMALAKPRTITIDAEPKDELVDAFNREWEKIGAINHIRDIMYIARVYGASAIVYGDPNTPTDQPIDVWKLNDIDIYFNQLDPLNLAGSIVSNQNPNAPDFQKPNVYITVAGQPYHPSRACVVYNNTPIYLRYQASAFGYTGRSIFQRSLYPLKSFVQSMITDDLVTTKAGLLIARIKPAGSMVNRLMQKSAQIKREYLQDGMTGNVLSIDIDEDISSIDMANTDTAMLTARDNIIANISASSDVPAILLKDEAFAQGFADGTEDAKAVSQYIDGIREDMRGIFEYFDKIVQHRAWNREFFEALSQQYPEYFEGKTYEECFYEWQKAFKAEFPSLMEEPPSAKVAVDEVKLRGITEILRTLLPISDAENKGRLIEWAVDNLNEMQDMFKSKLDVDIEAIAEFEPPEQVMPQEKMPTPSGQGM